MPMPYASERIGVFLLEQNSLIRHEIGSLTAYVKGLNMQIDEFRRDTASRLDKLEKVPAKEKASWTKDLPLAQLVSIMALIVGGFVLHFSPEEWKAILLAKFGK